VWVDQGELERTIRKGALLTEVGHLEKTVAQGTVLGSPSKEKKEEGHSAISQ